VRLCFTLFFLLPGNLAVLAVGRGVGRGKREEGRGKREEGSKRKGVRGSACWA